MGRIKDLTGKRYYMLTVKRMVGRINDKTLWECECDCGKTIITTTRTLETNHRKSCGCTRFSNKFDITGQRFGKLLVIKNSDYRTENKGSWWECKCDCGNTVIKSRRSLVEGHAMSCGCVKTKRKLKTHGMTQTAIYQRWNGMKKRCRNDKHYKDVNICPEWNDFMNFYKWAMENGFSEDLTLDRIDPYGDYEPSNCRWVNMKVQSNNKRNNTYITIDEVKHTLQEWSEIRGIDVKTIIYRLKKGMSPKDAVMMSAKNQPVRVIWVETGMIFDSINECSREVGVSHTMVRSCLRGKAENVRGYHFKKV